MTLFAHAAKGDLNHSNNPTYKSISHPKKVDGQIINIGFGKGYKLVYIPFQNLYLLFDHQPFLDEKLIYTLGYWSGLDRPWRRAQTVS